MSSILCPGIPTILDKDGKPDIHYLKAITDSGKLFCEKSGCKFAFRDKYGNDVWCSDYLPSTLPK